MASTDQRTSPRDNTYEASDVRAFITAALATDPAVERVYELLHEHVEEGRYHPTVVAETLKVYIQDIVESATHADWTSIASQLITDARETLHEESEIGAR